MEQVAVTLAEQGNKSVAESLRIRAAQIALDISWKS